MPRGGGKGETLLRTPIFKLRYTRTIHFLLRSIYSARQTFGGFCKKSSDCNDGPACGNRQTTKRSATAKQMHEATGLTVLALLLALPGQRPSCELSGKCKKSANE